MVDSHDMQFVRPEPDEALGEHEMGEPIQPAEGGRAAAPAPAAPRLPFGLGALLAKRTRMCKY